MTTNTIAFKSAVQAAIFTSVLLPELKAGHWAEARPHGHEVDWASAEVIVDPKRVGRNFDALRSNYNLVNKAFVDSTLEKAVRVAKKAGAEGLTKVEFRKELWDMMKIMRTKRGEAIVQLGLQRGSGKWMKAKPAEVAAPAAKKSSTKSRKPSAKKAVTKKGSVKKAA